MLAHFTGYKNQIGVLSDLTHLTASSGLKGQLNMFLLSCKVDGLSPVTIANYAYMVGSFVESCPPDISAAKITVNHVRMFLLALQERCRPRTVQSYYKSIKRFFNWLVEEGILPKSPMASLRSPKVPRRIIRPFSAEQIRALLLLCDGAKFLGARNKAIILLFLDTGLRLSELASIRLSDVDFNRELITVMGKGAKERVVAMGKSIQKALLHYLLMRQDSHPCLWVSKERRPLDARAIQCMIQRLGKRAGLQGVRCSPHTFRHTAAINCLRNGMGEFNLQWMLGHSTLQMTRRYVSSLGAEDAIKAHRVASPVDNMKLK